MVLYTYDAIHVGFFDQPNLTREDLLYRSTACKVFPDMDKNVYISVRYSNLSNLSVYVKDRKTNEETLCH